MSTGLLRPEFLWGLLALAVPVALHLINRRRTVRFDFSTLRFFTATAVQANRARRLRRLLQLICRLGIIAAVVLIFASPHDRRNPFAVLTDPQCVVHVWVDPTISMEYRDGGVSRVESADASVDTIAARVAGAASIRAWDDRRQMFGEADLQLQARTQTRYGAAGVRAAYSAVAAAVTRRPGPSVMVVASDMQEATAQALDSIFAADSLCCPVLCVSLAPDKPVNRSVLDARLSAENASLLEVRLSAQGGLVGDVPVHALAGALRAGRQDVRLGDGDTVTALVHVPVEATSAWGVAALGVADGFPQDDTCVFVRRQSQERGVLVVGEPAATFPIVAALGAVGGGFWGRVTSRAASEVRAEDVDAAALVVIEQLEYPAAGLSGLLSRRGTGRKAVIFAPSVAPAAQAFVAMVMRRFQATSAPVMDSSGSAVAPVLGDTISALWRGFPRLQDRTVAVYRYVRGLPGDVLLRLDNSAPLATRVLDSSGCAWVLMATPLGVSQANNLCETGFYVPLVDRLARHVLGLASPADNVWYAGWSYRNPYFGRTTGASAYSAGGDLISRWENQPQVAFERPGAYRVAPDGEAGYWLRVAMDPAESAMSYRAPEVAQQNAERVAVVTRGDLAGFLDRAGDSRLVYAFWLLLALLVLCEMLLWGQRPAASEPAPKLD